MRTKELDEHIQNLVTENPNINTWKEKLIELIERDIDLNREWSCEVCNKRWDIFT